MNCVEENCPMAGSDFLSFIVFSGGESSFSVVVGALTARFVVLVVVLLLVVVVVPFPGRD